MCNNDDVEARAALLDQRIPGWWKPDRVVVGVLDQRSVYRDVLGQLCGDYVRGLRQLGLAITAEDQRGFNICPAHAVRGDRAVTRAYRRLTGLWIAAVEHRRADWHPAGRRAHTNRRREAAHHARRCG